MTVYCTFVSGRQGHVPGLACALQLGELVADDAEGGGLVEHGLVDQHGRQVPLGR